MKTLNLTPHTGDAPLLADQLRALAEHLDRVGNIKTLEQSTDVLNALVQVLSASTLRQGRP